MVSISLVITGFILCFFHENLVDFKNELLVSEQESLSSDLNKMDVRMGLYLKELDKLESKYNNYYADITASDKIPMAIWNGGFGGGLNRNFNDGIQFNITRNYQVLLFRMALLSGKMENSIASLIIDNKVRSHIPAILPVEGKNISGFGKRINPFSGFSHTHTGIDFACLHGTEIFATGDGVVEWADYKPNGYGIHIDIDHQNGYKTKYAHLSSVKVKPGAEVKRGQLIGYSGSTGLSTGPHLHYEIEINGLKIDPEEYIYDDLTPSHFQSMVHDGTN